MPPFKGITFFHTFHPGIRHQLTQYNRPAFMQESLLVQTLTALTPQERQDLEVFLQSPLHNNGQHARQNLALFHLLNNRIAQKKESDWSKQHIYEALSPGNIYQPGYLENLMTKLLKLVRRFIAQQEASQHWGNAFEGLTMARFYREHGLPDRARQAIHRAKSDLSAASDERGNRRLLAFWLEQEISIQECLNNQRKGDLHVPATLQALTTFFGHQLLELATVLYQQQRVVPELLSDWQPVIEHLREILRERAYESDPAILMLDAALNLQQVASAEPRQTLEEFLELLRHHEAELPARIQKILAAYTRNFCVRYASKLEAGFRLALYREHLEKGWLYEGGKLQPSSFINLVNISLKAGEADWLETFLQAHRGKIEGEQADHLLLYGFARWHFQKKQWEKVEEGIREARKQPKLLDIGLEKLMRILEIKICYEQWPDSERLQHLLDSFKMFIQRNKRALTENHQLLDKNFVKTVRQMMQHNRQVHLKKPGLKGIRKTIAQVEQGALIVAERDWLVEKLTMLSLK